MINTAGFISEEQIPKVIQRDKNGRILSGVAQNTNKNGKAGRPCEFCKNKEMIEEIANRYYETCLKTKKIPFMEELSIKLKRDDDTVVSWEKKKNKNGDLEHPELSATIKKIKNLQRLRLLQHILGTNNPTGGIFLLRTVHGMVEAEKKISSHVKDEILQVTIVENKSNN